MSLHEIILLDEASETNSEVRDPKLGSLPRISLLGHQLYALQGSRHASLVVDEEPGLLVRNVELFVVHSFVHILIGNLP